MNCQSLQNSSCYITFSAATLLHLQQVFVGVKFSSSLCQCQFITRLNSAHFLSLICTTGQQSRYSQTKKIFWTVLLSVHMYIIQSVHTMRNFIFNNAIQHSIHRSCHTTYGIQPGLQGKMSLAAQSFQKKLFL